VTVHDLPVNTLNGEPGSLGDLAGTTLLVVNVASKCGLTPQYTGLEQLHERYAGRGFAVVGFPCNQFGGQEPGTAAEIGEFCSTTYGVTFPMFEKAGDVQWNFEKFLVGPDGAVLARFRPLVTPEDPELVAAIEANLPG